jgi:hypothetical protein
MMTTIGLKVSEMDLLQSLSGSETIMIITGGKNYRTTLNRFKSILTKQDVGLNNVDNTSDLDKPVSTETQQRLDQKANQTALQTLSSDVSDLRNKTVLLDFSSITDKRLTLNGQGSHLIDSFTLSDTSSVSYKVSVTSTGEPSSLIHIDLTTDGQNVFFKQQGDDLVDNIEVNLIGGIVEVFYNTATSAVRIVTFIRTLFRS